MLSLIVIGASEPPKADTVLKLGILLAHELFHLWVPNSLKLAGDYDWFFEGFTIYQALRLDLRLHLISFDDYLDTIARVYDSYFWRRIATASRLMTDIRSVAGPHHHRWFMTKRCWLLFFRFTAAQPHRLQRLVCSIFTVNYCGVQGQDRPRRTRL